MLTYVTGNYGRLNRKNYSSATKEFLTWYKEKCKHTSLTLKKT